MKQEEINKILAAHGLESAAAKKLDVGFTNAIYQLDDKYILKICSEGNETPFRNESKFYKYFHGKLPVPELITYEESSWPYMIYKRIDGENLYNVWHLLNNAQRRDIIKQLCGFLKIINESEPPPGVELKAVPNWREHVISQINYYLEISEKMKTLKPNDIAAVKQYLAKHSGSLDQQVMALVYWDVHFDNFIVKGDKIVGFLDMECIELASIDFVLDTVRLMVDSPKKYMSNHAEQFAKDEDYAQLLDWYREFYPELFGFRDLNRRLDLYGLAHSLKDLKGWPNVQQLKDNIRATTQNPS